MAEASLAQPEPWRWGAEIDESSLLPGGDGVTIHVDAAAADGGDGSATRPFNSLAPAVARAISVRAMLTEEVRDPLAQLELPIWLRLVRQGDRISASSAADRDGRPGEWQERVSAIVPMDGEDYLGVYALAHGDDSARAVLSSVTINGNDTVDWQLELVGPARGDFPIGPPTGEFSVTGSELRVIGSGSSNRWFEENYAFVHAPVSGEVEMVARLDSVESGNEEQRFMVGVVLRDKLTRSPRLVELSAQRLTREPELGSYVRRPSDDGGRDVRVLVRPGVYRFDRRVEIAFDEEAADQGVLVI
ncbi:MAG: hypothetical protein GF320_22865 [Armatimonadia bacterium]|nr:hypothetical protein [Armatimonadia bacterium]